jgi:hypothetical protein
LKPEQAFCDGIPVSVRILLESAVFLLSIWFTVMPWVEPELLLMFP